MRIRHIMRDGKIRENIDGHIVRMGEAKATYALLEKINRKER